MQATYIRQLWKLKKNSLRIVAAKIVASRERSRLAENGLYSSRAADFRRTSSNHSAAVFSSTVSFAVALILE